MSSRPIPSLLVPPAEEKQICPDEKKQYHPYTFSLAGFVAGCLVWAIVSSAMNSEAEYRKTANEYLGPDGDVAVAKLSEGRARIMLDATYLKLYARAESWPTAMRYYSSAARAHNAIIDMTIASYNTGWNEESRKHLQSLYKQLDSNSLAFRNWYNVDASFDEHRLNGRAGYGPIRTTSMDWIGKATDVVTNGNALKEDDRERRLQRMVELLQKCKLPPWSEVGLSASGV